MIPIVRFLGEKRLTTYSRRDASESAIRESYPGCTGPSLAPNLPQIGRELGGWPVSRSIVSNRRLLLLRWCWGANRLRSPHLLIHPIELRLQLNQFTEFLRRWHLRSKLRGPIRCDLGRAAAAGRDRFASRRLPALLQQNNEEPRVSRH